MSEKIEFHTKNDYDQAKKKMGADWLTVAATIATLEQIVAGLEGYTPEQIFEFETTIKIAGLDPKRIKPHRGDGSDITQQ